jgi:succinoglycan biosynthesis transport protein ExoP
MIELTQLPDLLRRHLLWLIVTPLVFMMLAVGYVTLKTPVYRAGAELLIEPEGLPIVTVGTQNGGPGSTLQRVDIDSQVYVILSSAILNDVANKLDLDNDPALTRPGGLRSLLSRGAPASLSEGEKRAAVVSALRDNLQVNRMSRSQVFEVRASHPDPVRAAEIANEVVNSYISEFHVARSNALEQAGSSLGRQAAELRKRVQETETAVEVYKAKKGLISTGTGGLVVDQQIQALNSQIAQASADLEKAKAAYLLAEPLTTSDVGSGGVPQAANYSVLNTLRLQYSRTAQQEAEAATTLGANHPTLRELRSQLSNTQKQISAELQRVKRTLKSDFEQAKDTLSALQQQSKALQSQNSTQGKALVELRQLQSEAEASRSVYEAFLKRATALEQQTDFDSNGTRVLSEAQVPSSPSGPSKLMVLVAAGAFGFAAAAGGIVGLAMLRGQVTSEREIVARTGIPALSLIPRLGPSGSGHLDRLFPGFLRQAANDEVHQELALTRVAYALRQTFADQRPATILVLSSSGTANTVTLSRRLAMHLHDMGDDVLFASNPGIGPAAPGNRLPSRERPRNRSAAERLSKVAEIAGSAGQLPSNRTGDGEGLSRYLSVERVDDSRKYAGQDTLAAADEDFLIIDCGAAASNPILPVLLRHCHGILLVSEIGETSFGDLDRTLAYLQPWQDRVIGNVILSAA